MDFYQRRGSGGVWLLWPISTRPTAGQETFREIRAVGSARQQAASLTAPVVPLPGQPQAAGLFGLLVRQRLECGYIRQPQR